MSLPYERGGLLPDTAADLAKLRAAWRIVERRHADGTLFNFSGLERSLDLGGADASVLDDDLAPALFGERLKELALEHLGGDPERDDVFVANRLTAAIVAAMQVLVRPGDMVVGVSARYSHPVVVRAVKLAGGELFDTMGYDEFAAHLDRHPQLVVLTRLAAPPPSGMFEIHAFELYGAVMVVFFIICFPLTRLAAYLERRLVQ